MDLNEYLMSQRDANDPKLQRRHAVASTAWLAGRLDWS